MKDVYKDIEECNSSKSYFTKENTKEHNPNSSRIPDHWYRILTTGGSGSGKTNALLKLTKQQDDDNFSVIDKIHLNVKDPNEAKY